MKPKYTPGPWKIESPVKDMEIWNQNTHIATINHHYKFKDQPKIDKANAKLIAAAPELLDALNDLAVRFEMEFKTKPSIQECKCNQFLDTDDCRHLQAFRAIKKARGAV